jgi:hypothetical protein
MPWHWRISNSVEKFNTFFKGSAVFALPRPFKLYHILSFNIPCLGLAKANGEAVGHRTWTGDVQRTWIVARIRARMGLDMDKG